MVQIRNKIISGIFLVLIVSTTISIRFYDIASDMLKTIFDISFEQVLIDDVEENKTTETVLEAFKEKTDMILDILPYKTNMVELNGSVMKAAGTRSYYNNMYGINITSDGYNVGRYNETTTDYEVQEIIDFKEYLDEKGIQLLYVSEPAKYIDDKFYTEQFGGESYLNRNTDLFLSRISESGVEYLDLRDNLKKEKIIPNTFFYKTDHHWTVPASKWAAFLVAEKLNRNFGYNIDLSLYDDRAFNKVKYEDCWLGEQGKLVSKSYMGLDDYTMIEPVYDTDYSIISEEQGIVEEGDFGIFIDKSFYESTGDYYSAPSWHYSYSSCANNTIHNNNVDYGNILVLGDSYEASMIPFLSLGVQNIEVIIPRGIEGSVRDYIENRDYDTVIIAYAQFMIGAHDDESNANYRMFDLE